jgi:hypothetical protein
MAALNRRSAAKRGEKGRLRAAVRAGDLQVGELLARPPECLSDTVMMDIVLWKPRFGLHKQAALGRRALAKQVNLLGTVGNASERSRSWLAREIGEGPAFYDATRLDVAA